MPKVKGLHHRGTYDTESRKVVAAANASPFTRCWKCKRTLAEVARDKRARGKRTRTHWCAGHINRAEIGGALLPECSECSAREGQAITAKRQAKRRTQHTTEPITALTLRRR